MDYFLSIFIAGFVGGVVRGLVGLVKHQLKFKNISFRPWYLFSTVGVSGVVGLLAAWVTRDLGITFLGMAEISPAVALVIGYAGGDFIENLFKMITGKTTLYDVPSY